MAPTLQDLPQATTDVLDLLKAHLPYSLPVLRRCQTALQMPNGHSPTGRVLFAHNPERGEAAPAHFAVAYVDLGRGPETQCWLYSTLQDGVDGSPAQPPLSAAGETRQEQLAECADQLLVLLRRIRGLEAELGRADPGWRAAMPSADSFLLGGVHEALRQAVLARGVRMSKTSVVPPELDWEFCGKWLFRTDTLPEPAALPEGMRWDVARTEDFEVVRARTSIKRSDKTLLTLPSTFIRLEDGTPVAWVFLGFDGSIVTLHCEEPYRGRGLAKAVARKCMKEHVKDYGDDGWCHADVFEGNSKSQGVCRSIGGKQSWIISWAMVDLTSVGEPL